MAGLFLVQSNRLERLAELFAEAVRGERAARDGNAAVHALFLPVRIVTAGRPVEELLRRTVAARLGVAANLAVENAPAFLTNVARASAPGVQIIERRLLEGWVLTLLHDARLLSDEALAPVQRYLQAAGSDNTAVDRRRLQLGARLVALFEACAAPPRGQTPGPPAGTWQRRLWDALFGEGGMAAAARFLSDFYEHADPATLVVPPRLHLFAPTPWNQLLPRALPALCAVSDVRLYHFQPCREHREDFDEDVRDSLPAARFPARERGAQLALGEALDPVGLDLRDPVPSRLWAGPARQARRRLMAVVPGVRVGSAFEASSGKTVSLLGAVERHILDRGATPGRRGQVTIDDSVAVLACPGLRREVETVAADIWRLCEDSAATPRPLRFDEIAIYVPAARASVYFTHVAAVFRDAGELPHRLVDAPAARGSRVFEAIDLLLTLPLGGFTRKEVMRVVLHPAVLSRFAEVTAEDWVPLPDLLGIAHGADHADHKGTYIDANLFNWDQGLRRLALGAFCATTGDDDPVRVGDDDVLPAHLPTTALPAVLSFGWLMRSLIADTRVARSARVPLREWVTFLRTMVTGYVTPEGPEDERALDAALRAVSALADMPVEGAVSYALAAEVVRQTLAGLTSTRAAQPAAGVTVAPLAPGRVLPARVVYVMGLDAREFPRGEGDDELDPRARAARTALATPADEDRALFLEALCAARERLCLSYVARNVQTGDDLEPSPVVRDLGTVMDDVAPGSFAARTRHPALHRHDDPDVRRVFAAPAREAQAATLAAAAGAASVDDLPALRAALTPPQDRAFADAVGLPEPTPAATPEMQPQTVRLSLSALRRFLECPLQGSAAALLGLREGDDDAEALLGEDEPFATTPLDRARLLRGSLLEAAHVAAREGHPLRDDDALSAYRQGALRERLAGRRPLGLFEDAETERHHATLRAWGETLRVLVPADVAPAPLLLGGGEEHEPFGLVVDPLRVPLSAHPRGATAVDLVGRTSPVARLRSGETASFIFAGAPPEQVDLHDEREACKGYIDALVLAARRLDDEPIRAHVVHVVRPFRGGDGTGSYARRFGPFARGEARDQLTRLVDDLYAGMHEYLLPIEAVIRSHMQPDRPIADVVASVRDSNNGPFSSSRGPVPFPERHPAPPEAAARAMIRRRFAGFFPAPEPEVP